MRKMANKKGFTIVELVIVIAVIAILAGVMIPTFSGVIDKANQSARQQAVTAAYKDAYGVALSDGDISANEVIENDENGFIFVFNADDTINAIFVNTSINTKFKDLAGDALKVTVAEQEITVKLLADDDEFDATVESLKNPA